MRVLQAKANRILSEPLLEKELRASIILSVVSVGIEKNQIKQKKEKEKLKEAFGKIIQKLVSDQGENRSGVHTRIKSAA
jgi:hypothetical protein